MNNHDASVFLVVQFPIFHDTFHIFLSIEKLVFNPDVSDVQLVFLDNLFLVNLQSRLATPPLLVTDVGFVVERA